MFSLVEGNEITLRQRIQNHTSIKSDARLSFCTVNVYFIFNWVTLLLFYEAGRLSWNITYFATYILVYEQTIYNYFQILYKTYWLCVSTYNRPNYMSVEINITFLDWTLNFVFFIPRIWFLSLVFAKFNILTMTTFCSDFSWKASELI